MPDISLPASPIVPISASVGLEKSPKKARLEYLDALRGLAALLVVYLHVSRDSILSLGLSDGWEQSVMNFFVFVLDLGKTGVVLFFAISGFIIPASFSAKRKPAVIFVVSRFFRLYPAYWVSLIFGLAVLHSIEGRTIPWTTIIANITMAQAALGKPDVVAVYWTLFIELVFYAFCLVAFLSGRLGKTWFSFGAALVTLFGSLAIAAVRYYTHKKLPVALVLALSIMIWASLWRNNLNGDKIARRLSRAYLALFTLTMPLISLLAYNFDTGFEETWYRYTISYYVGIGMFLFFTKVHRINGKMFVWLGAISYSLYLMHPLVLALAEKLNSRKLPLGSGHILFLEVALGSVVVSALCHYFVEKPCIRLGHYVRGKLDVGPESQTGSLSPAARL